MVIVLLFDMDDDRAIGLLSFINNTEFCVLAFKLYWQNQTRFFKSDFLQKYSVFLLCKMTIVFPLYDCCFHRILFCVCCLCIEDNAE